MQLQQVLDETTHFVLFGETVDHNTYCLVDVGRVNVAVHRSKAQASKEALEEIVRSQEFDLLIHSDPRCVTIAKVVGGEESALKLFGIGQVVGFWHVCTPANCGVPQFRHEQFYAAGSPCVTPLY